MAETFREWRNARRQLKKLSEEGSEVEAKRQLLRYQVEELDQLGLAEGELATLEEEQHTLAHAEETLRETTCVPCRAVTKARWPIHWPC